MVRISEFSETSEKFAIPPGQKDRKSCNFIITLNTTNTAKQNGEIDSDSATTRILIKKNRCTNFSNLFLE